MVHLLAEYERGLDAGTPVPRATWQASATYDGLTVGTHTIRIEVLGRHSAASAGNRVTSDAFRIR